MGSHRKSRGVVSRTDGAASGGLQREVRGMARGSSLNLVGAVCSQLSLLAITLLLARELGRADVGRYAQSYAFLSLLGLLALSGFRAGLTRFVVVHLAEGDAGAVRGTVRLGLGLTVASSTVLASLLYVLAPTIAEAFQDDQLVTGLRLTALALPATTFMDAALAATQGWRTMRPYAIVGSVTEPLTRLGLTAVLVLLGHGLTGAFTALLVSSWVGATLAGVWLLRYLRPATAGAHASYRCRELFTFSSVSWVASLASTGLIWSSTLILGALASSAAVGVYNVATRLVSLAVFVMPPINGAFGPRIAHLHHAGRTDDLRRTYGVATSWILRLSLPAFVALVAFPGDLLAVFGEEFVVGVTVTTVLALGKLVDAATGPCALMLNMCGRPALNMVDNVGGLALNIALSLWLIPPYGIEGAAVAWAVSLAIVNLARLLQVRAVLGMLPFDAGVAKGAVAGAVTFLACRLAHVVSDPPLRLPFELAVLTVTYVGVLLALGLTREDRTALRALSDRTLQRAA